MNQPNLNAGSGRKYRDDGVIVNEANFDAPQPNGGQSLVVNAAGVVAITVPENTIMIVISNPVPVRIAYGTTASATVGTYYPANSCPILPSPEACKTASVYFTAACTGAYAQAWE